ncbi:MAG: polymer-forming cytoskeletal protein [Burkholderiales bacterium]|jgi:cytoskeletal protein CcmA (bactofilin family)|nr:polymer-forming cytoskeletal protein [Burkholderiales bacterium]
MFFNKKNAPNPQIDCLINADTVINGDILFNGGLRVDGAVNGNIITHEGKSGTLIVSRQAKVEGRVAVTHAVINGEVQGDILAEEFLQLEAHARVSGNITYHTLEMHHGAVVSGRLTHAVRVEQAEAAPSQESGITPQDPTTASFKEDASQQKRHQRRHFDREDAASREPKAVPPQENS